MTFFMVISESFKKSFNVKKFQKFEDINPVIGIESILRGLQILFLNMAAQFL